MSTKQLVHIILMGAVVVLLSVTTKLINLDSEEICMGKTAQGLITFAKSKLGTAYIYGAKGKVLSKLQIDNLRNIYGSNCVWWSDSNKAGQMCVDCSGLISWYTGIVRGSGQYKQTAVEVISINRRTNAHIGWAVWMSGHIGIYLGDDTYIAADGSAYGVRIANLSQNQFTHLIKLCDIDYGQGTASRLPESERASGGYYNSEINIDYAVMIEGGKVLPFVKNLSGFAGIQGKKIVGFACKVSRGTVKYKITTVNGTQYDYVTGCDFGDFHNGFAGDGRNAIALLEVYLNSPGGDKYVLYKVSPVGKGYYSYQRDSEKGNGMDGYAGSPGVAIDRVQMYIK